MSRGGPDRRPPRRLRLLLAPPGRPAPEHIDECIRKGFLELMAAYDPGPEAAAAVPWLAWLPEPCPPAAGQRLALSGGVFVKDGTPLLSDVSIAVRAEDGAFEGSAELAEGRWELSGVPAGVRLQVSATHRPSGTVQRRLVVPLPHLPTCGEAGFARVNFGGREAAADWLGFHHYFDVPAPGQEDPEIRFEDVPANVPLALRASAPGYRDETREVAPLLAGDSPRLAFGGPLTGADPGAQHHGLTPLPRRKVDARITLSGRLFRLEDGAPPTGGYVHFGGQALDGRSISKSASLDPAATYRLEGIPAWTRGSITVLARGYTLANRLVRLGSQDATFNFGGPSTAADPQAPSFGPEEGLKRDGPPVPD